MFQDYLLLSAVGSDGVPVATAHCRATVPGGQMRGKPLRRRRYRTGKVNQARAWTTALYAKPSGLFWLPSQNRKSVADVGRAGPGHSSNSGLPAILR